MPEARTEVGAATLRGEIVLVGGLTARRRSVVTRGRLLAGVRPLAPPARPSRRRPPPAGRLGRPPPLRRRRVRRPARWWRPDPRRRTSTTIVPGTRCLASPSRARPGVRQFCAASSTSLAGEPRAACPSGMDCARGRSGFPSPIHAADRDRCRSPPHRC